MPLTIYTTYICRCEYIDRISIFPLKKHIYIYLIYTIGWGKHHCFSHFLQFKINFFPFPLFNFRVLKNRIDKSLFPLSFCVCYLQTFSIIRTRVMCVCVCVSIVINAYSDDNESLIFNFYFLFFRPRSHKWIWKNNKRKKKKKLNYWLWQIMNYHAFKLNSINVIGKCLWRLIVWILVVGLSGR